nr:MAG TPA: hypothetical protein [Caudoviricetes sp.]
MSLNYREFLFLCPHKKKIYFHLLTQAPIVDYPSIFYWELNAQTNYLYKL